jgi:Holliday junction resolvasome RuvABC endonuclease subunit
MQKTYIYAFDLSMSQTGIAIFNLDGTIEKVCSVSTKDKDSHGKRLKVISDFILELKYKYPVKKIIIERAFSRFNTSTAVIFRVHGLINYIFWDSEQIYYTPKAIKAELLNGKASKKQIQENIIEHYPDIKFENEDESDATSVGIAYFMKTKIINWK